MRHLELKYLLKNKLVRYLDKKVKNAPDNMIRFKKSLFCGVWFLDNNWDHDCREIEVLGLSCITRHGFVRPNDIDGLENIIKILFKVLFFGIRKI